MNPTNLGMDLITELRIDTDKISIPIKRYEELIRAEVERDIAKHASHFLDKYRIDDFLALIWPLPAKPEENPESEEGGGNA